MQRLMTKSFCGRLARAVVLIYALNVLSAATTFPVGDGVVVSRHVLDDMPSLVAASGHNDDMSYKRSDGNTPNGQLGARCSFGYFATLVPVSAISLSHSPHKQVACVFINDSIAKHHPNRLERPPRFLLSL